MIQCVLRMLCECLRSVNPIKKTRSEELAFLDGGISVLSQTLTNEESKVGCRFR